MVNTRGIQSAARGGRARLYDDDGLARIAAEVRATDEREAARRRRPR